MSEIGETYAALRVVEHKEKTNRMFCAKNQFEVACERAAEHGMTLERKSDSHYQLKGAVGWLVNLYPTTWNIHVDRNKPQPPFIKAGPEWTLLSVVDAYSQG